MESSANGGIDHAVADLDDLRRALGAEQWTLDGVSYGTFVAERYAIAHPKSVKALVLDSVLPHVDPQADDALYLTGLRATARVLRAFDRGTPLGDGCPREVPLLVAAAAAAARIAGQGDPARAGRPVPEYEISADAPGGERAREDVRRAQP